MLVNNHNLIQRRSLMQVFLVFLSAFATAIGAILASYLIEREYGDFAFLLALTGLGTLTSVFALYRRNLFEVTSFALVVSFVVLAPLSAANLYIRGPMLDLTESIYESKMTGVAVFSVLFFTLLSVLGALVVKLVYRLWEWAIART